MDANEIREVLNGIWAVSSFCVLALLLTFIAVKRIGTDRWSWRFKRRGWWRDSGVQLAGALTILIAGHFLRAFPQWIQFITLNSEPHFDTNSKVYQIATLTFIPATVLTVVGKILCVWSVSPGGWNYWFAAFVFFISLSVPVVVFWLV